MSEPKIKLCNECKTGFPAKWFIQEVDSWWLVCAGCSKKLNSSSILQHTVYETDRAGIYEAKCLKIN